MSNKGHYTLEGDYMDRKDTVVRGIIGDFSWYERMNMYMENAAKRLSQEVDFEVHKRMMEPDVQKHIENTVNQQIAANIEAKFATYKELMEAYNIMQASYTELLFQNRTLKRKYEGEIIDEQ